MIFPYSKPIRRSDVIITKTHSALSTCCTALKSLRVVEQDKTRFRLVLRPSNLGIGRSTFGSSSICDRYSQTSTIRRSWLSPLVVYGDSLVKANIFVMLAGDCRERRSRNECTVSRWGNNRIFKFKTHPEDSHSEIKPPFEQLRWQVSNHHLKLGWLDPLPFALSWRATPRCLTESIS